MNDISEPNWGELAGESSGAATAASGDSNWSDQNHARNTKEETELWTAALKSIRNIPGSSEHQIRTLMREIKSGAIGEAEQPNIDRLKVKAELMIGLKLHVGDADPMLNALIETARSEAIDELRSAIWERERELKARERAALDDAAAKDKTIHRLRNQVKQMESRQELPEPVEEGGDMQSIAVAAAWAAIGAAAMVILGAIVWLLMRH